MRTLSHVYNYDIVTTRVWVPVCHLGPASRPRLWLPSADTSGSGLNLSLSRTQTWRTSTDHIIAPAHHPRLGGQGKGQQQHIRTCPYVASASYIAIISILGHVLGALLLPTGLCQHRIGTGTGRSRGSPASTPPPAPLSVLRPCFSARR